MMVSRGAKALEKRGKMVSRRARAGRQSCGNDAVTHGAMPQDWGIKRRKDKDNEEKSKKDEEIFGDME